MNAGPADIEAPTALRVNADGSVQLRLLRALDASVTHYFIVVVPDQLAAVKQPADFTLDQVPYIVRLATSRV